MIHRNGAAVIAQVAVGYEDIDMSARQTRLNLLAQRILQIREGARHPEGKIQKAVIDAFELDGKIPAVHDMRAAAITRHAQQGKLPPLSLYFFIIA